MRIFSTRDIFGIFVALGLGLLSLGAWQSFFSMILNPDTRSTVIAFIWFSFLSAVFFLGTVTWRERFSRTIAPVLVFLPSFLFVHTWYHLIFIFCSGLIAFLAIQLVQGEIEDRVRFHFFRNVRAGSFTFILGLSLALSSAYFASIQTESWEELVPRFKVGEGTATALFRTLAYFYPEWKNLATEGTTVDDFLLHLQTRDTVPTDESGALIPQGAADTLPVLEEYLRQNIAGSEGISREALSEELYLRTGHDQVATLVGRPVRGDEKIADVFSAVFQHKIVSVLNGEQASQHLSPVIVPLVLATLLFLTLLPAGSVAGFFWIALGLIFFRIGLLFGWIRLERVAREQEILLP